jgi:DNA invertase Pin-like site-specific DNA recombinase
MPSGLGVEKVAFPSKQPIAGHDFLNALAELAALGVAFISLRDNIDLSTPSGRLMFQIIGAMAEFERALIQERVRAGIRNARAKGKRLVHRPYSYLYYCRFSITVGTCRELLPLSRSTRR